MNLVVRRESSIHDDQHRTNKAVVIPGQTLVVAVVVHTLAEESFDEFLAVAQKE